MEVIQQHWPWFVVGILFLAIIYAVGRKMVDAYSNHVRRTLEEYVRPQNHISPEPVPLPMPIRNQSDSASLADRKEQIWRAIQQHPLAPYPQIELLVHQLAVAQINAEFQDIYFTLFGSQHLFLIHLNRQLGTGALSRDESQSVFDTLIESQHAVRGHNFNNWVAFLVEKGFVEVSVDRLALTTRGQDFLVWVMRKQLPTRTYEGV